MMRDDHPSCTLDGQAMAARLARIRTVTSQSLVAHRLEGRMLHLTYRLQAARELERLVALERECCAFLDFSLETGPAHVVLTIAIPQTAQDNARWLVTEFLPRHAATNAAAAACHAALAPPASELAFRKGGKP